MAPAPIDMVSTLCRTMASDRPATGASGSYRVRLTLCDSDPPIIREIAVPKFATLLDLHNSIQACFGWSDYHMHIFTSDGTEYGIPCDDFPDCEDETIVPLSDFEESVLDYNYDFGDDWHVDVEILGDAPNDRGWTTLLSWENDGPPEDCGGIYGFYENLEKLSDPSSEDYEDIAEFMEGYEFDEELVRVSLLGFMPQGIRPMDAYIASPILPALLMMPISACSSEPIAFDLQFGLPFIITDRPVRKSKRRDGMEEPPMVARKDVEAHPERYIIFSENPLEFLRSAAIEFLEENSIPVPDIDSDVEDFIEDAMYAVEQRGLEKEWDDFLAPTISRLIYDWAAEKGIYFLSLEAAPLSPAEAAMKKARDSVGDDADLDEFLEALMNPPNNKKRMLRSQPFENQKGGMTPRFKGLSRRRPATAWRWRPSRIRRCWLRRRGCPPSRTSWLRWQPRCRW